MAITLLLLCGAPAFADIIVYNQPPTLDGNLYASQNDPIQGNFATLYDNFKIVPTIPYYLTDVHFYGGYFNPQQHGVITGWRFRSIRILWVPSEHCQSGHSISQTPLLRASTVLSTA